MIRYLILGLVILSAGCAVAPSITPIPSALATFTAHPTTILSTSSATPTLVAPTTQAPETRIIVQQNTPFATPGVSSTPAITVTRLATPLGWRTYVHPSLQLAVDYPPDWTVRLQDNDAIFTSPQGAQIELMPIDPRLAGANDEMAQPNTRCVNSLNPYGLSVRSCSSTIGFSIDAYLTFQRTGKPASAAVISTRSRGAVGILNNLIESARLTP